MTLALTVAILAYNEEANLRWVVEEMAKELESIPEPWEIMIVNDGSSDGTGRVADELAREDARVRVVHHEVNRGLGGGYRTGFDEAKGTFLIFFPADGQFSPDIITRFYRQMGELDMLLGYLPNSKRPLFARAASVAEKILYRVLIGKMPKFQGVLMFRTSLAREIELELSGRGWGIILEFIFRVANGPYRVRSTPTDVRKRISGESKVMNTKTIKANLEQLFALRDALKKSRR
ncbi:MAG: glycosyltransferase family 2 protein [Myxococcales bacterium]|nr:glycosyltransferase family 2 protein [Myxococcales bacterium]